LHPPVVDPDDEDDRAEREKQPNARE
jgi:hypothetical protein